MKGYNGVAILSRMPLECTTLRPTGAARATAGTSRRRCKRPAARSNCTISTSRPAATSRTARRTRNTATSWTSLPRRGCGSPPGPACSRSILVGDLNIAPLEHDVWSHKQLLDVVSHTPPETEGLNAWMNAGFIDAVRHFVPADQKLYTWWSYRNQDWRASDRGRRLDHIWVTPGPEARPAQPDDPARRAGLAAWLRSRAGLRGGRGLEPVFPGPLTAEPFDVQRFICLKRRLVAFTTASGKTTGRKRRAWSPSPVPNRNGTGSVSCFVLPFVAMLWVSSYNRLTPELFGFPFYYWYQLAWVIISAAIAGIIYKAEH